jgi:hypothetical protein
MMHGQKTIKLITVPSKYFEHPSVHPQENLHMQIYGVSFMHLYERNTIKLHAEVFLRNNTWMFEICRRHYT